MRCSICNAHDTKVIDSRILLEGNAVRRRRKCESCNKRFTTYERIEIQMPAIVKNDGRREAFNREKIIKGLNKACHKRQISTSQIDVLIASLEKFILENFDKEVSSKNVGEMVMTRLNKLDHVAYVRFASFYWEYKDIDDFVSGLQRSSKFLNDNNWIRS